MSSFMCCKETIWNIASFLCKEFPAEVADELRDKPNIPGIYRKLVDMNVSVLKERYGDNISDLTGNLDEYYNYSDIMSDVDNLMLIKTNMSCYLYQCSEGDVTSTSLFKLVDKAHYYLCDKLVQDFANMTLGKRAVLNYWG